MYKKSLFYAVFILCQMILFISCTKEAPAGKDGVDGIDGRNGASILSGQGIPQVSVGKEGDYYIDMQNALLYGPKTLSGWGNYSIKLQGENGVSGVNGSTILNGPINPNSSVGSVGDYYINNTSTVLFGPKSISGWGAGLSLKGSDAKIQMRTYIYNNPWNSLNPLNGTGHVSFSFFPPITRNEINNSLFLAYIETSWKDTITGAIENNFTSIWSQVGTPIYWASRAIDTKTSLSINTFFPTNPPFLLLVFQMPDNLYQINTINQAKYFTSFVTFKLVIIPQDNVQYLAVSGG
jgi:hypothetical protein